MTNSLDLEDIPTPEYEGTISPDELDVDGDNPNEQDDDTFGLLCDRLRQNGWLGGPIVTDTNGLIADGEHRWRAAQDIGLSEVPVKQYDIDDATRRLYRQELNKLTGSHDSKRDALEYDLLLNDGKTDEVHQLTNATGENLDELLAEIKLDTAQPPQYDYDPDHNVYFEDCIDGMRERLEADSVDCVITDQPYGINWQSNHREQEFDTLDADSTVDEAIELFDNACQELARILKPDGHLYVCTRWDVYSEFQAVVRRYFEQRNLLVWAKNNWGMGSLDTGYRPQHEFIIFAHGDEPRTLNGQHSDLLEYSRPPTTEYSHPTEKPASLIEELLYASTDNGDRVLDPFMGGGTTAVAAIQNQRDYVGFEIDKENYQPVIERRIGDAKRQREAAVNE